MHVSIPVEGSIEFISSTQISPLISHCEIKVCYLGENRNGTSISKEVAMEMGKNLPGSPIVGFFNEEEADFEEHNKELSINEKEGTFKIVETTRPYGFVPTDAKIRFQDFVDDNSVRRTYLVTEGYIWTGAYPESERIFSSGNNQSMELNEKSVKGRTEQYNEKGRFFIINEAIIEKLCILGENVEPCFEGAQIRRNFSFDADSLQEFKNTMHSMVQEIKTVLKEGGSQESMDKETILNPEVQTPETETEVNETVIDETVVENSEYADKDKEKEKNQDKTEEENSDETDNSTEGEKPDEKKKKYNLEEVVEYAELSQRFSELEEENTRLSNENQALNEEIIPLRQFRLEKDREAKQEMINSFYMLSEEDKSDVVSNIDKYSLEDIEKELSVICFRRKINFSLNEQENEENPGAITYNLESHLEDDGNIPAWVKLVQSVNND